MARGFATWQFVKMIPDGSTMLPDPVHADDMPPKNPWRSATTCTHGSHDTTDSRFVGLPPDSASEASDSTTGRPFCFARSSNGAKNALQQIF